MFLNVARRVLPLAVSASLLAACSGGGSNGNPPITSTPPTQTGVLQFAVGTANVYGTATGLNVVSTYRNTSGLSNTAVNTPAIVGPMTLPPASPAGGFLVDAAGVSLDPYSSLPGGPSVEEVAAGNTIDGTSQTVHPGTPACDQTTPCAAGSGTIAPNTSTFGQSGGVFTNGLFPGNFTDVPSGLAASYTPYLEPLYDTSSNTFIPFGGPPAFDPNHNGMGLRDGLHALTAGTDPQGDPVPGPLGIPEGMTTFEGVVARPGAYTLTVQVPTGFNGPTPTFASISKAASLASTALLGAITAPALNLDGNGGGTFTIPALPAGVTEEFVQIVDYGPNSASTSGQPANCQGAIGALLQGNGGAGPVYYTLVVKAPGTYTLPDTDGPNLNTGSGGTTNLQPSPSICSSAQNTAADGTQTPGDDYSVQAIGVDYPLYESLYPNSASQTPAIAGGSGQADITISALSGPATAAMHARRPLATRRHR